VRHALEIASRTAGIAGIALVILFYVFRDSLRKLRFPKLTRDQSIGIIRLMLWLVFVLAVFCVAIPRVLEWNRLHVSMAPSTSFGVGAEKTKPVNPCTAAGTSKTDIKQESSGDRSPNVACVDGTVTIISTPEPAAETNSSSQRDLKK